MTPPTSEAVPLIGNFAYITINYSIVLSSFFLEQRKLTFEDVDLIMFKTVILRNK